MTSTITDHSAGTDSAALIAAGKPVEARKLIASGRTQDEAAVKALNTAVVLHVEHGFTLLDATIRVRDVMRGVA